MGFFAPIVQGIADFQTAEFNADVADDQAEAVRQAERINAASRATEFRKVQSANIARAAGRGLKIKGAPMQVLIDNAFNFERDQAIARYNSEVRARQFENRGSLLRNQGRSLLTGGLISGVGDFGLNLQRQKEVEIPNQNG